MDILKVLKIELKNKKMAIVLLVLIQLISVCVNSLIPILSGNFLNLLISGIKKDGIIKYSGLIIIIGTLGTVLAYLYEIASVKAKNNVSFKLNKYVIDYIQKIPIRKFEEYNPVYLNQRVNSDSAVVGGFFFDNILLAIVNGLQLLLIFIIIVTMKITVLYIILLCIFVYSIVYEIVFKSLYVYGKRYKEEQNIFFNSMNENYELSREIRAHSLYENISIKLVESYRQFFDSLFKYTKVSALFMSLDSLVSLIFQAIIFLYGGFQVIDGNLSIGEFSIMSIFFSSTIAIIKYFFQWGKEYQEYKVSVDRMNQLLLIEQEENGTVSIDKIDKIQIKLRGKYIDIDRNGIYVVRGANGSGKTTLIYKIIGLLYSEDTVKINDKNINSIDIYALRRKVDIMLQNERLPNTSVEGYLNLNFEFVEHIMNKFCFDKLICLKDIWHKNILEMSDGERQFVVYIKTIMGKNEILILDEPSSDMSVESINLLMRSLNMLKYEKKVILITHNKQLYEMADSIIDC